MGSDNRSQVIKEQLKVLGAEVRERLSQDTTHVIFKDGSKVGMEAMDRKEEGSGGRGRDEKLRKGYKSGGREVEGERKEDGMIHRYTCLC